MRNDKRCEVVPICLQMLLKLGDNMLKFVSRDVLYIPEK